jgi:hypothetical protein
MNISSKSRRPMIYRTTMSFRNIEEYIAIRTFRPTVTTSLQSVNSQRKTSFKSRVRKQLVLLDLPGIRCTVQTGIFACHCLIWR